MTPVTASAPHRLDFATSLTQWDYAPAPESVKPEIAGRYGLFINGEFVEPGSDGATKRRSDEGGYFPTLNPATEATLAEIAQAGDADVDAAVRAAREALPAWAGLPAKERGKYLYRIARRIQERARELAVLETMDGGKPIRESRDVDIPLAAAHFFYHAGWADKLRFAFPGRSALRADTQRHPALRADEVPGDSPSRHGVPTYPEPIGVCAQIIPWNFPLLMAAWKLAPALACGNTCVLKPAETTSLTALRLAEICQEVGLPKGVVNIITGDGRTGAALVDHPYVNKIAFTGSTEVGKKIARACAGTGKRLTLELGGKSPNIIFEDASLDQAVEGIVEGIYFNQGHVCCAGSRLFVQESVLDEVIAKLEIRMASLRVGDPLDKNTDIGAINSRAQLDTIGRYVDAGMNEGARLHVGGSINGLADRWNGTADTAVAHSGSGYWCRPSFFTGVQPSHTIARDEIFGPVLAVMSFRTPEEAITRANNTPYGLAAGVWTDKGSKIFEIASKLKAGVVWLNTYNKFDPASPFGGFKESGFGREGGVQGLRGYLQ
jgi:aldehyde dehydrogenase (NAD+)